MTDLPGNSADNTAPDAAPSAAPESGQPAKSTEPTKPTRKVAKTMLETSKLGLPTAGDVVTEAADDGQPKRKVAKTLLYSIGNLHRLGISQELERMAAASANQTEAQPPVASVAPDPASVSAAASQDGKSANTAPATANTPGSDKAASIAAQSITGSSKISPVMPQVSSVMPGTATPAHGTAAVSALPEPVISPPPAKSERKVARTLLFKPVRTLDGDEAPSIEARVMAGQKIADAAHADAIAQGQDPTKATIKRKDYVVAKTMLDHSVLFVMSSRNAAKAETRAQEIARERANEPLKPVVEAKKKALPCKWVWDEGDGYSKDRFRHCGVCQQVVYDFKNLDKSEAEAIVYTRENIEKPVLYKRTDGKYMVNNCPVAVKHRKNMIVAGLVASFFVAGLVTIMVMMPPPPPPPPKPAALPTSKDPFAAINARNKKPQGTVGPDGTYYYRPGQATTAQPGTVASPAGGSVGAPNTFVDTPPVTQTDEQFWQYSGDTESGSQYSTINDNPKMADPAGGPVQQYSQSAPSAPQQLQR
ncbi:MAG: hypothetical protein IPP57_12030 [Candidatus Obscuribacter sp.]|nr:hypothetical protein [Candidatus Obscuribacter sp.]